MFDGIGSFNDISLTFDTALSILSIDVFDDISLGETIVDYYSFVDTIFDGIDSFDDISLGETIVD